MTCRICTTPTTELLDLGTQPLANGFRDPSDTSEEYRYHLVAEHCPECGVVQLREQPEPERMFAASYPFLTGSSAAMVEHFTELAHEIGQRVPFGHLVAEIGCNDGTLLAALPRGVARVGVEPSSGPAKIARRKGLGVIEAFFGEAQARSMVEFNGRARVIVATNCLAHVRDIHDFMRGVSALLAPDGEFISEDPSLGEVIAGRAFDQIYDEHAFIFGPEAMAALAAAHGLSLVRCEAFPVHGGSMRYTMRRGAKRYRWGRTSGLDIARFRHTVHAGRYEIRTLLEHLKHEGKRVIGYGATSKSTTMLNWAQIGPDLLPAIADNTPQKIGKVSPGMRIPIISDEEFRANPPDVALLLAWNHADEILAKERALTERGMRWLTYVPEVRWL